MKRFILTNDQNVVISVRYGDEKVVGEIESMNGDLGQVMQADGTFIDPVPSQETPQPTLEDKVNYLYYKSLGVI